MRDHKTPDEKRYIQIETLRKQGKNWSEIDILDSKPPSTSIRFFLNYRIALGDRLKLFNEKAEKLLGLRFVASLLQEPTSFSLTWKKEGLIKLLLNIPDAEERDAFILTFRFFYQDNERSSFHNVAKAYDLLPVKLDIRIQFHKIRNALNNYLDSIPNPKYAINGKPFTRREMMEIIIYGGLAHANREKKEIFDRVMEASLSAGVWEFEFVGILSEVVIAIASVKTLNRIALSYFWQNFLHKV